ncbi:hypothetical protein EON65_23615 [archaeon]|nr:MAG: hypothetical protein EON65_23615 [archaeon]
MTKNSTPFLSDESDYLRESFSVPVPNTTGLQNNSKFSYSAFPGLSASQVGNVRKPKVLVKGPELKRIEGEAVSTFIRDQLAQLIAGKDAKAEGMESTADEVEVSQEQFFEIAKKRFLSTCHAITTFQQAFRARKCRAQYRKTLRAILTIQCMYARYKRRRLKRLRVYNKQCIRIQTAFRRHRAQLQLVKVKLAILRLQAMCRRQREVRRYRRLKQAAYAIRNAVLTFFLVKKLRKIVEHEFKQALMLLTYLYLFPQDYGDHCCSLVYKSVIYLSVKNQTSLVYLQIIYDELERVYYAVGLSNPQARSFLSKQRMQPLLSALHFTHASNFADLTRAQKVTLLLSMDIMQRLHMLHQSAPSAELLGKVTMLVNEFMQKSLPPDTLYDQADRHELYRLMKAQQTSYHYTYDQLFSSFPLSSNKKRKQGLAQLVWRCAHPEHLQQSCLAVITLHARERYHRLHPDKKSSVRDDEIEESKAHLTKELFTIRFDERVRGQVQSVLRACLHSLNRRVHTVHSTGSQKSSLSNHIGK